jgi:hypothetical protein
MPALGFACMATYLTVWAIGAAHQLALYYPTVLVLIVLAAWWGGLTMWASRQFSQ